MDACKNALGACCKAIAACMCYPCNNWCGRKVKQLRPSATQHARGDTVISIGGMLRSHPIDDFKDPAQTYRVRAQDERKTLPPRDVSDIKE